MSRGVYRSIYTRLFDDPNFQRLSSRARHVLLTARLCEQAGPAAIYRYYPELLARQTGYTVKQVMEALAELDRGTWTVHDAQVLWICNGLRYDPIGLRVPNFRKAVQTWVADLPASPVVVSFCERYELGIPSRHHGQTFGEVCPPKEQEQEQEQEQETTRAVSTTEAVAPVSGSDPVTKNSIPVPPKVLEKIPDLARWPDPQALVALWNHHAVLGGLSLVETLSAGRQKRARELLRQFPDWRWWNGALSKIKNSRFLTGGVPPTNGHSESFRAHFDWLLATKDGTENVVALHDGRYDR